MLTLLAGAGTAGCATESGARDEGRAPSLSAPPSPSPLWPGHKLPTDTPAPELKPYAPVKPRVPDGGLRKMSVPELIAQDPNVPGRIRVGAEKCPGSECGLREPVYRDLTGDGKEELVVALDEEASEFTLIEVYRATGRTVRPVLVSWGYSGLTCSAIGRDLIVTGRGLVSESGTEGELTTRYRWNGTVMSPVVPRNGEVGDGDGDGDVPNDDPNDDPNDNPAEIPPERPAEQPDDRPADRPGPPAVERPEQ